MSNTTVFSAGNLSDLHEKLDAIVEGEKPYRDIPLILPASGESSRSEYRGLSVRYWRDGTTGKVRYDTGIEWL